MRRRWRARKCFRKFDWPGGAAIAAYSWVATYVFGLHWAWWLKFPAAVVIGGVAALLALVLASLIEDRLRRRHQ
jgi:hypothetical protein